MLSDHVPLALKLNIPCLQIILTVTDVLRRFTGDPGLLPPSRVYRHSWTCDQYTRGTSAYPSLTTEDHDFETLGQPLPCESDPRLLFAGEATDPRFWGQMLGARLSGLREAQRVLDRIAVVGKSHYIWMFIKGVNYFRVHANVHLHYVLVHYWASQGLGGGQGELGQARGSNFKRNLLQSRFEQGFFFEQAKPVVHNEELFTVK